MDQVLELALDRPRREPPSAPGDRDQPANYAN
jgi:hypothetical protein